MKDFYIWAATDRHEGVTIATRVYASVDEAKAHAQECIGDGNPVEWDSDEPQVVHPGDDSFGVFEDSEGFIGYVTVSRVRVPS